MAGTAVGGCWIASALTLGVEGSVSEEESTGTDTRSTALVGGRAAAADTGHVVDTLVRDTVGCGVSIKTAVEDALKLSTAGGCIGGAAAEVGVFKRVFNSGGDGGEGVVGLLRETEDKSSFQASTAESGIGGAAVKAEVAVFSGVGAGRTPLSELIEDEPCKFSSSELKSSARRAQRT